MTRDGAGEQLDLLGVPPAQARSTLAAVIASVPSSEARATASAPSSPLEWAVRAHASSPSPEQPSTTAAQVHFPAPSGRVAPGGDVEAWEVLDEAPLPAGPPELVAVPGLLAEQPRSALDGVREELAAMHRDGVAADPAAAAQSQFGAAIRAGQASASPPAHPRQSTEPPAVAPETHSPAAVLEVEVPPAPGPAWSAPPAAPPAEPAPSDAAVAVPAAMADDFGPLVPPARTSKPSGRAPREPSRRWRRWLLAAAGAGLVVVTALAAVLLLGGGSETPDGTPAAAVQWRSWHGIELPVSTTAGPQVWQDEGDRVSGFARSELGAAIAAAHLSVRVDPAVGEQVWGPVLAEQAVGEVQRLRAALEAAPSSPDAGQPGRLDGWRLDGDPGDDELVVHLAVRAADGSDVDYAVSLAWHDGDWALKVPAAGPFFPMSDTSRSYADFGGQ